LSWRCSHSACPLLRTLIRALLYMETSVALARDRWSIVLGTHANALRRTRIVRIPLLIVSARTRLVARRQALVSPTIIMHSPNDGCSAPMTPRNEHEAHCILLPASACDGRDVLRPTRLRIRRSSLRMSLIRLRTGRSAHRRFQHSAVPYANPWHPSHLCLPRKAFRVLGHPHPHASVSIYHESGDNRVHQTTITFAACPGDGYRKIIPIGP